MTGTGAWWDQGDPHSAGCRWCGGPRTEKGGPLLSDCAHACLRCDVGRYAGKTYGPPKFMRIWEAREEGQ